MFFVAAIVWTADGLLSHNCALLRTGHCQSADMFSFLKPILLIGTIFLAACSGAQAQVREPNLIRVGIQETLPPEVFADAFGPTMLHLRTSFPSMRFVSQTYSVKDLLEAIRTGSVDVFFADSGVFLYSLRHQTTQIAARLTPGSVNPNAATAMALVAPVSDKPWRREDAAKLRLASDDPDNTSTWMAFQCYLLEQGYSLKEVEELQKNALFTHYEFPDPLTLLMIGEADLAIVQACTLEEAQRQGAIPKGMLHVVDPKNRSALGCAHSSEVFPGVIMGGTPALDASVLKAVILSVQMMSSKDGADEWGIVNDFSSVDSVYQRLQTGPYSYLRETDWRALWQRHQEWFWSFAAFLFFVVFHVFRSRRLVEIRTRELRAAEQRLAHERERMFFLERAGIVSGLCSMLVHEVKQPLAALTAYAGGLRMALRSRFAKADSDVAQACEAILGEAGRIDDIVEHVRTYARSGRPQQEKVDMSEVMKRALLSLTASSAGQGSRIIRHLPRRKVAVMGDPLELELAVLNLMKNGLRASRGNDDNRLEVALSIKKDKAEVTVRDFGEPIGEDQLRQLASPGRPQKKTGGDGLGIGLMLVRRIVESHSGSLVFKRADDCGIIAVMEFPLMNSDTTDDGEHHA